MSLQTRLGACQLVQPSGDSPGAPETFAHNTETKLTPQPSARVIVVLGYREIGVDGSHRISAICRAAVRRAESLAEEATPRAVIFTGWSSTGGPTEADQMAGEWKGHRDVALIREPRATNTAENAVRSLQILQTMTGVSEVITVCSIRHFPRVRFFFNRLYTQYGYSIDYRYVTSPSPSPRLVLTELSSITRMARDRRHALRLLKDTDDVAPICDTTCVFLFQHAVRWLDASDRLGKTVRELLPLLAAGGLVATVVLVSMLSPWAIVAFLASALVAFVAERLRIP